jgi:amino acid permease
VRSYLNFGDMGYSRLLVIVSVFGTLGFAEEEFWSSCLKLLVVIMFVFIGMYVSFTPSVTVDSR